MEEPVFHRDLKPDNILYQIQNEKYELILADFGCAFLMTDDNDRLTNEFRAVGPMAFRSPEHHHGRVDTVDEKGDIFSLGKILWYLINGINGEVFPYTLWFPNEYNLSKRFPGLPGIEQINLLVASMVHHDPNERIGYEHLEKSLRDISSTTKFPGKSDAREEILVFEANRRLLLEERKQITSDLISLFSREMNTTLFNIKKNHPQSEIIRKIYDSFNIIDHPNRIIDMVVLEEIDVPLWNHHQANIQIQSRIFPVNYSAISKFPTKFPLVRLAINVTNSSGHEENIELWWFFRYDTMVGQMINDKLAAYNESACAEIFEQAIGFLAT